MDFSALGFRKLDDALSDTAILYATSTSPNTLGYHSLSPLTRLTIAGHDYTVAQRPEYLKSERGVTGAVVWWTSVKVVEYLARQAWFVGGVGGNVLELGSGVGLVACVVSDLQRRRRGGGGGEDYHRASRKSSSNPTTRSKRTKGPHKPSPSSSSSSSKSESGIGKVIASDHDPELLKLIHRNLERNAAHHVAVMQLDWSDSPTTYLSTLDRLLSPTPTHTAPPSNPASSDTTGLEWVLCLDCVYSTYLSDLLINVLETLVARYVGVKVMIGQQIREETLHAEFIGGLVQRFRVWRLLRPGEGDDAEGEGDGVRGSGEWELDGYALYVVMGKSVCDS